MLHEIGHAVGFIAGQRINSSTRTAELRKLGEFKNKPTAYSAYLINAEHSVANGLLRNMENHSKDLYDSLTGRRLIWGSQYLKISRGEPMKTMEVNVGPVMIWTRPGGGWGEVSHIDEYAAPGSTGADDLMTPYFNYDSGDLAHQIGPVTLAMLYDLGWQLTESGEAIVEGLDKCGGSISRERTVPDSPGNRRSSRPERSRNRH